VVKAELGLWRALAETVKKVRPPTTEASNLIALATHGRGGLKRLLLGSVADKLVRGAASPVLVYLPTSTGLGLRMMSQFGSGCAFSRSASSN